ncbi:hypothetical protein B484DRAFT_450168 [Ochromonadaceae sp. CCMP2298]|nr:hypothetical protein B484DRAFT_450168 [Ochromonadaceae sp. CCMP2298]
MASWSLSSLTRTTSIFTLAGCTRCGSTNLYPADSGRDGGLPGVLGRCSKDAANSCAGVTTLGRSIGFCRALDLISTSFACTALASFLALAAMCPSSLSGDPGLFISIPPLCGL